MHSVRFVLFFYKYNPLVGFEQIDSISQHESLLGLEFIPYNV